jgi:Putative DNA-binding domain
MPPNTDFDHVRFAEALLDPERPPPEGAIVGGAERRFRVYRNNVFVSLIDALEQRFPVCLRLVGREFFRASARLFIRRSPPTSPVLAEYGDAFPAFIEGYEPARDVAYLADVARLEIAADYSYHSADATSLEPEALAALAQETIGDAVFTLHPSLRLVASPHPIVSIWRLNVAGDAEVVLKRGEDAMVVRPERDVFVSCLPRGGYKFVKALAQGETLSRAAASAIDSVGEFDLAAVLEKLIAHRAVTAVTIARA